MTTIYGRDFLWNGLQRGEELTDVRPSPWLRTSLRFFHVAKMFTFWCCFRCLTSSNIPWLVLTVFCLYLLPQTLLVRNKTAVEICLTLTNLLLLFYSNVKSTSCSLPLRTTCSVIVVNNSWYCWTRSTFTYQSVCTVRFIFSLDKDTIIVVFCGF